MFYHSERRSEGVPAYNDPRSKDTRITSREEAHDANAETE